MNLKLCGILAISSIAGLAISVMPNAYSEESRQDSEKHQANGFPLDIVTKANERAESLIKYIEDSNAIPQDQKPPEDLRYQISYGEDGYVDQITYSNGFKIQLFYVKNEKGKISSVSFAMADSSMTVQIDVNDNDTNDNNNFVSNARSGDREHGIELNDSNLEKLLHSKAQDLPLRIAIKAKADEISFGRLLSSLKKATNTSTTSGTSTIDFPALKKTFDDFKKNQEMAFNHYTVQSRNYYDTLAPLLKEGAVAKRSEIDYRVDQLLNESRENTGPQSVKTKIAGLQPILSDMYIAPSRERLKKALENNISVLQKRLYEMLILGETTTIIHTDETSTEIIILLQQIS